VFLSLVAAMMVVAGNPSQGAPTASPINVVNDLRSMGYKVVSPSPNLGTVTVSLGNEITNVQFTVGVTPGDTPRSICFYTYYRTPRALSVTAIEDWESLARCELNVQMYLNRTLCSTTTVTLDQFSSVIALRDAINQRLADFGTFHRLAEKTLGCTPTDRLELKAEPSDLSDARIVDYVSFPDVIMLAKNWGWEYKGPYGGSLLSAWCYPLSVEGQVMVVSRMPGSLTALSLKPWPTSMPADLTVKAHPPTAVIDTLGGMTLGELKHQIIQFSKELKRIGAGRNKEGMMGSLPTAVDGPAIKVAFLRLIAPAATSIGMLWRNGCYTVDFTYHLNRPMPELVKECEKEAGILERQGSAQEVWYVASRQKDGIDQRISITNQKTAPAGSDETAQTSVFVSERVDPFQKPACWYGPAISLAPPAPLPNVPFLPGVRCDSVETENLAFLISSSGITTANRVRDAVIGYALLKQPLTKIQSALSRWADVNGYSKTARGTYFRPNARPFEIVLGSHAVGALTYADVTIYNSDEPSPRPVSFIKD
jgi:hypothetical protein